MEPAKKINIKSWIMRWPKLVANMMLQNTVKKSNLRRDIIYELFMKKARELLLLNLDRPAPGFVVLWCSREKLLSKFPLSESVFFSCEVFIFVKNRCSFLESFEIVGNVKVKVKKRLIFIYFNNLILPGKTNIGTIKTPNWEQAARQSFLFTKKLSCWTKVVIVTPILS